MLLQFGLPSPTEHVTMLRKVCKSSSTSNMFQHLKQKASGGMGTTCLIKTLIVANNTVPTVLLKHS